MKPKNGLKRFKFSKEKDLAYEELFMQYLKKCDVNNLSEHTIKTYKVNHRYFSKFLKQEKNIEEPMTSDITKDLIDDYIIYLKGTGIKAITVNTYVQNISPIIKHGMELGLIERFGFKEIKTTEEIKEVYTDEELFKLLKKPELQSFAEYRNWVIINFLLGTGVRALELRNIRIKDVDLSSSMLILRKTKNRKQRYVPVSKTLNKILTEYIDYRRAESDEGFLFCNEFGEYMPRTTLQGGITKYCKRRGVNKYSLHLFRHTFCKKWVTKNGNLFVLQKILGHSSLKMVNHYSNLYSEDLQQNFNSFCALESVSKNFEKITLKG